MVPADKPREAFAMIQRFLNDEPLWCFQTAAINNNCCSYKCTTFGQQ